MARVLRRRQHRQVQAHLRANGMGLAVHRGAIVSLVGIAFEVASLATEKKAMNGEPVLLAAAAALKPVVRREPRAGARHDSSPAPGSQQAFCRFPDRSHLS
jgi:hypothetical protein